MRTRWQNIVLVGFMGTGKTSVGRKLAERLGLSFTDMDSVIEEREGKPISRIFAEQGEPHFRTLERNVVKELAGQSGRVIATGGGVVLNPDNVKDFVRTGLVVCLSAAPETLLQRVAADTTRPLLKGGPTLDRIRTILDSRQTLYDAIPVQIDTTHRTVEDVVEAIVNRFRQDPP